VRVVRGLASPSPASGSTGRVPGALWTWWLAVGGAGVHPPPQKFNTFNTFNTIAKFAIFAKFAKFANFNPAVEHPTLIPPGTASPRHPLSCLRRERGQGG
jgi:hypothetical protein